MKVLITGTTKGIGNAIAKKFLACGHTVIGLDLLETSINDKNYIHYVSDVRVKESLPKIDDIEILVNNAGVQDNDVNAINVNLLGLINTTKAYGYQKNIKAIV